MKNFCVLLKGIAAMAMMMTCANGFTQYGLLDAGFGNNGKVVTPQPVPNKYGMQANEAVVQSDGKIVIAASSYYDLSVNDSSRFIIIRYNVEGSPDTTFGTGGIVVTDINHESDIATTLALQPDGKIIAAGSTRFNRYYTDWAMVRYNTNGSVDSTFGVNGIVVNSRGPNAEHIYSILIKPDGKILAAGDNSSAIQTEVIQFKANGTVDSSFGTNGVAVSNPQISIAKLLLQPDGNIVAAGTLLNTDSMAVIRFRPGGNLDTGFGIMGRAYVLFTYGRLNSLLLQADGKMILAGHASDVVNNNTQVALARLKSNGTPDSTFGTNGKVFSLGGIDQGCRVIVRPDGKILVTASKDKGFSYFPVINGNFALLKYSNNGILDSTFGKRGVVFTDFAGKNDEAYCSVIQPDGKIIIAGFTLENGKNKIALARYESAGLTYYNTITASVFYDNNLNGIKEPAEPYFSQADNMTLKAGIDTIHIASNGRYSVEVDSGAYTTLVKPYFPYFNVAPPAHNTVNAGYFNFDTVAFAVQPMFRKRDLAIQVIPIGLPRPGFPVQYKIFLRNNGTDTIPKDTVELIKSSKLIFNSAFPAPDSTKGDTLRWNISDFKPLDTTGIIVYLTLKAPPVVNIGDTLISVVQLDSSATELTPDNNISKLVQVARGALDPNNKTENHGGKITTTQIADGDYMQYTIRFQNTGNDTAFNVYIHDTLSNMLNWNTLQIITASYNYEMTMNDGQCLFTFSNINLVDSNKNEPASHGNIVYRIKPRPTVALGNVISNTAAIYFDYNLPVYTNAENTMVVSQSLPLQLLFFTAKKQGKINLLQWTTAREVNVDYFEIQRSSNGRDYFAIGSVKANNNAQTNTYQYRDDVAPDFALRGAGGLYYRLRMIDHDGRFTYSPVRIVNNNTGFSITVYPSPAKDKLQLQINSDRQAVLQMQVLSLDGKILLNNNFTASAGSILRSISINSLQNGSYILKVTSLNASPDGGNTRENIIRFEKL